VTMSVTIRSAALDDIPIILAIERQSPSAAHWTAEQYHKLVGDGVVLFAECAPSAGQERKEQGSPCGFICAKAVAGEWEIENVVVAAEFLRRGVADELMRGLIQGRGMKARRRCCWKSAKRMGQRADCTESTVFASRVAAVCTTTLVGGRDLYTLVLDR